MAHINAYLTFSGNCREAMTFYQDSLGGDLALQTIGETPMAERLPPTMKEYILHATLSKGALMLMGSDMVGEQGRINGNAVSLVLHGESEEEIRTFYAKLSSDGGRATQTLETTFWGALLGGLTDKFGNNWLIIFDKNKI